MTFPSPKHLGSTLLLALALILGGCTTATTVVWEAAKKLHEQRTTDTQFTDTRISAGLMSGLAEKDLALFMDVNADVWDSRVLLTGTVTDSATRTQVLRHVRGDKRIAKIYNEIQVVSQAEQDRRRHAAKAQADSQRAQQSGSTDTGNDLWIETKIAAKLIAARDVTSVNYRWRSVRNTLYVIGCAKSRQELDQVLTLLRETDGVRRVKSFVDIKTDATA